MKLNFSLALLSLVLITTLPALAQRNWKPALVLFNQTDTLKGLIDDRQWRSSPTAITFKTSGADTETIYTPHDILYFYLQESKELYQSVHTILTLRPSKTSSQEISEPHRFSGFSQVLIVGPISLVKITYLGVDYFFIQSESGKLEELVVKKIRSQNAQGNPVETILPVYRTTLKNAMSACEAIQQKIEKSPFNEKSIVELVATYNDCRSMGNSYRQVRTKPVVIFGVAGGLFLSSLNVVGTKKNSVVNPYEHLGNGTMSDLSYSIGVSMARYFPRDLGRLAIYTDLLYTSFSSERTTVYGSLLPSVSTSTFSLKYIKLSPGIRYSFRRKYAGPYLQAGPTIGFNAGSEVQSAIQHPPFPDVTINEKINAQFGVFIGAGMDTRKVGGEIRYGRTTGFSIGQGLVCDTNDFYFLLKYQLGKSK